MFTTNFNKILLTLSLNFNTGSNTNKLNNKYIEVRPMTGLMSYPYNIDISTYSSSVTVMKQNVNILNGFIMLGTGNTTPTVDDYKLSGTTISLTNQVTEVITQGWNSDGSMEILYKVTGTPSANNIIKEIGLVKNVYRNNSNRVDLLLYREVLATPITITSGTPVELYFKLKFKLT